MKDTHVFIQIGTISIILLLIIYGWNHLGICEQEKPIDTFHGVYAGGLMNVYLKEGEKESLVIRADDFVIDQVKTKVENGILKIYTEGFIRGERITDAYVTYKKIDYLEGGGATTLISQNIITAEHFKIKTYNSAEIKVQLDCDTLVMRMDGNANVQLAGKADHFDLQICHVGDLMAYHFETKTCKTTIDTGPQSPGIARIHVRDSLDVSIKGPRHLYYRGEPAIKEGNFFQKGKQISAYEK